MVQPFAYVSDLFGLVLSGSESGSSLAVCWRALQWVKPVLLSRRNSNKTYSSRSAYFANWWAMFPSSNKSHDNGTPKCQENIGHRIGHSESRRSGRVTGLVQ